MNRARLQAGVDVATIALWLGHERLGTTHRYVEADLQLKERALGKLEPLGQRTQRFKAAGRCGSRNAPRTSSSLRRASSASHPPRAWSPVSPTTWR